MSSHCLSRRIRTTATTSTATSEAMRGTATSAGPQRLFWDRRPHSSAHPLHSNAKNARLLAAPTVSRTPNHMEIADEALFKRMLRLERRRSERTGSRFALMLIDMEDPGNRAGPVAMEEIGAAIAGKMRETDITGWYKSSRVLGVILTTLNGASRRVLESAVVERTRRVLLVQPAIAQLQHIWITCHIFPDDQDTEDWGGKLD